MPNTTLALRIVDGHLPAMTVSPADTARRSALSRAGVMALGERWRDLLPEALGIEPRVLNAMLDGAMPVVPDVLSRAQALAAANSRFQIHEVLASIAYGMVEDGAPRSVLAAQLENLARAIRSESSV